MVYKLVKAAVDILTEGRLLWEGLRLPKFPSRKGQKVAKTPLKSSRHDIYFFNQKFDYGVNEALRWVGINLMIGFQDITQYMFCIFAQISHPADLEIYYFNLECAIELY